MAVIDSAAVLAEGVRILARQATSSALSATATSASASVATTASSTGTSTASATSSAPSATDTDGDGGGGGGGNGGGNSSPLLFFVALGFGVVFTNLWIIVGVKYCFRYNARNRQPRLTEDGEPINMGDMPRPHRRRREKKLMTMDEVNEKFPMLKYKTWVASRATQGLPTAGGVSRPASRAASVNDVEGVVLDLASKERSSADEARQGRQAGEAPTSTSKESGLPQTDGEGEASNPTAATSPSSPVGTTTPADGQPARDPATTRESESPAVQRAETNASHDENEDDDHDDDEPINAALPPECLGTSGDTCAICIDTLEDDDDVRGLTCGHAFHAVCLDPWLTSRRACCPLCKTDYYTPKPRPAVSDQPLTGTNTTSVVSGDGADNSRTGRLNLPSRPTNVFLSLRNGRLPRPGTSRGGLQTPDASPVSPVESTTNDGERSPRPNLFDRFRDRVHLAGAAREQAEPVETHNNTDNNQNEGDRGRVKSAFARLRGQLGAARHPARQGDANEPTASGANATNVTPSDLEAGTRS